MTKYEIAANIAIAKLDDNTFRKIPATQQREMFGSAVLGRKSFAADSTGQGTAWISFYTDGSNCETVKLTYAELAEVVAGQRRIW